MRASPSQHVLIGCAQNIDGDGRWKIEWYGVPCNVGDSKLQYSFTMKDYYFFEFVVSNTRIPINGVSVYINGKWLELARTHTNTWAYYRVRATSQCWLNRKPASRYPGLSTGSVRVCNRVMSGSSCPWHLLCYCCTT